MEAEPSPYRDQSPAELRLSLLEGDLDLGQFTLLHSGLTETKEFRVRAGIIGASHVIQVELSGANLHEVLACGDVVTESARFYSRSVAELPPTVELELAHGVSYCFRPALRAAREARGRLQRLEARIARAWGTLDEIGLCHTFPQPRGCDDSPRTLVWVGLDPARRLLRAETAHSYPNEDTVVFSDTRVWLPHPPGALA